MTVEMPCRSDWNFTGHSGYSDDAVRQVDSLSPDIVAATNTAAMMVSFILENTAQHTYIETNSTANTVEATIECAS